MEAWKRVPRSAVPAGGRPEPVRLAGAADAEPACSGMRARRGGFAWLLAGNVGYAACQWGALVVLAKLTSPEDVGIFSLGLAITAPVFMFASMQLRTVQATDGREQHTFPEYLAVRLLCCTAALAVAALCAAAQPREAFWVVLIIACGKALESFSDLFYGFWQQQERPAWVGRSLMAYGAVNLGSLIAVIQLTRSVLLGTAAFFGSRIVILALVDVPLTLRLLRRTNRRPRSGPGARTPSPEGRNRSAAGFSRRVADLLLLGFPLGAAALLMSLNTNLPRYFVDHWRGKADLGVYSAMAALITAGTMLTKSLNQSSAARMARIWNSGDRREFSRLLARLLGTGCLTGAAGLLAAGFWSRELLTLLFRREYAAYPAAFLGIMTAAWLSYLVGTVETALFAVRALGVQLPLRIASSLATLAACACLVPAWGVTGAAWALVVGRLPVAVLGLMVMARTVFGEGRLDGGAAAGVDLPRPHWSTAVPVSAVGGAAGAPHAGPAGAIGSRGET